MFSASKSSLTNGMIAHTRVGTAGYFVVRCLRGYCLMLTWENHYCLLFFCYYNKVTHSNWECTSMLHQVLYRMHGLVLPLFKLLSKLLTQEKSSALPDLSPIRSPHFNCTVQGCASSSPHNYHHISTATTHRDTTLTFFFPLANSFCLIFVKVLLLFFGSRSQYWNWHCFNR